MRDMHVVAIGWLYVTVLMAFTQPTVVSGVATFLFYGLFPAGLMIWILDAPRRRRRRQATEAAAVAEAAMAAASAAVTPSVGVAHDLADQPDRQHAQRNQ